MYKHIHTYKHALTRHVLAHVCALVLCLWDLIIVGGSRVLLSILLREVVTVITI